MTDRIDLDDLDDESEDAAGTRGDWLWEADTAREPTEDTGDPAGSPGDSGSAEDAASTDTDSRSAGASSADRPSPHVPRANKDRPVGVPIEGGGAGGGAGPHHRPVRAEGEDAPGSPATTDASGPHGGGAADMTMAITYRAVTRLADPAGALADATRWADWIGIVGDVEAHVIQKFQRDNQIDVDFFNGSGTGPGERLAAIDPHSMFFAERMVLVGVEGEDEAVAAAADWEFVPLSTAAGEAGWPVSA